MIRCPSDMEVSTAARSVGAGLLAEGNTLAALSSAVCKSDLFLPNLEKTSSISLFKVEEYLRCRTSRRSLGVLWPVQAMRVSDL